MFCYLGHTKNADDDDDNDNDESGSVIVAAATAIQPIPLVSCRWSGERLMGLEAVVGARSVIGRVAGHVTA